jgi:hypothetical protein
MTLDNITENRRTERIVSFHHNILLKKKNNNLFKLDQVSTDS